MIVKNVSNEIITIKNHCLRPNETVEVTGVDLRHYKGKIKMVAKMEKYEDKTTPVKTTKSSSAKSNSIKKEDEAKKTNRKTNDKVKSSDDNSKKLSNNSSENSSENLKDYIKKDEVVKMINDLKKDFEKTKEAPAKVVKEQPKEIVKEVIKETTIDFSNAEKLKEYYLNYCKDNNINSLIINSLNNAKTKEQILYVVINYILPLF